MTLRLLLLGAAYLCGSVPFGLVLARLRRVDLRAVGSGNVGATNAARALGRGLGALTLFLDAAKAVVPLYVAEQVLPSGADKPWWVVSVALCAFLGHLFPCLAGFAGGKGVATALGIFLYLSPMATLLGVLVWLLLFAWTRISSVGSLGAVCAFPVWLVLLKAETPLLVLSVVLLLLILVRHRQNLVRLWNRTEQKL